MMISPCASFLEALHWSAVLVPRAQSPPSCDGRELCSAARDPSIAWLTRSVTHREEGGRNQLCPGILGTRRTNQLEDPSGQLGSPDSRLAIQALRMGDAFA